ncbi:hypothetical protein [Mycobacteroides salmoniphilum]
MYAGTNEIMQEIIARTL